MSAMKERWSRLIEHMLRIAKPGAELAYERKNGPETEDTTTWSATATGDIELWFDQVYPGMHALPAQLVRTIPKAEAHAALAAHYAPYENDANYLVYVEKKWGHTEVLEKKYRIVNVFTVDGDRLSGNPLCVFEDGTGLSDEQMQKLARQMNLSETTFVLPAATAAAPATTVRIFTPTFEMPFAGHPTLGTAHVVRALTMGGDAVKLSMKVGVVDVTASSDTWTLVAAQKPVTRKAATREDIARIVGLEADAIIDEPLWVDTGAEQLVIPLRSVDDVKRARPDAALLAKHGFSPKRGASMAYVWARASKKPSDVTARFFFLVHGGVVEDPATGSACANLGGWHIATKQALPVDVVVSQGAQVGRPSRLGLRVDADETIRVSGDVIELGRGSVTL